MKTDIASLYALFYTVVRKSVWALVMMLTLLLADACKDDDAEPAQASDCRLAEWTSTAAGRESETVTYTTAGNGRMTYDDQGNQTGSTTSRTATYSDGTAETSSGNIRYEYDAEGFLLRVINQSTRTERDNTTSVHNNDTRHTYENGRLIKTVIESTYNNGGKQTYLYAYEYNGDGNLIKYTNLSTNEVTRIDYIGKKVAKVTRVDANGVETIPFFEYNGDGRLVKWIEKNGSYTEEYRYEYDSYGQVTRRDRYIDGKTNFSEVNEYDTRQSPYIHLPVRPKGHPAVPSLYAEFVRKGNNVRSTYYDGDAAGTGWKVRGSAATVYDYNGSGFPVSGTTKSFDGDGAEIASSSAAYVYEGCR